MTHIVARIRYATDADQKKTKKNKKNKNEKKKKKKGASVVYENPLEPDQASTGNGKKSSPVTGKKSGGGKKAAKTANDDTASVVIQNPIGISDMY
jgi:hypothetical protein